MTHAHAGYAALFIERLARQPAVMVTVEFTHGSAPREAGTWMGVFDDTVIATIGGGHLEFEAIAHARQLLAQPDATGTSPSVRYALGPSLGQCCGGVVNLRFERLEPADVPGVSQRLKQDQLRQSRPLALFGSGHVGHALVDLVSRLPFAITWIDSRENRFPGGLGPSVVCEHSEPVQAAVPSLAAQSHVVIMSFSHAEDLDIVAACLSRQREQSDLPYIGLIGSQTKWATFRHRLQARGFTDTELAHVTCPIGIDGITGKQPEVIAVAVAAQLLQSICQPRGA